MLGMSAEDVLRGLSRSGLGGASPAADLLGHRVPLGDDPPGLLEGDLAAVQVAHDIRPPRASTVQRRSASFPAMTHSALRWWAPHSTICAWYTAASCGSTCRAVLAEQTSCLRSLAAPALVIAWPLRSVSPVSDARGVRPVNA
jgi:hypothetical protein